MSGQLHFILWERTPVIHWVGCLLGPRSGLDILETSRISLLVKCLLPWVVWRALWQSMPHYAGLENVTVVCLRIPFLWDMMVHSVSQEQTFDVELSLGIMCLLCLFPVKLLLMSRPSSLLVTTTLIALLPQPIHMCCCLHSNLSEILLNIEQV